MKTISIAIVTLLFTLSPLGAADGELLAREPVALDASVLLAGIDDARRDRLRPLLGELGGAIELSRITYESGGLKVRGYLATPKSGETLPCVIFNRGGNREFGALSDLRAASLLGKLARRGYITVASLAPQPAGTPASRTEVGGTLAGWPWLTEGLTEVGGTLAGGCLARPPAPAR